MGKDHVNNHQLAELLVHLPQIVLGHEMAVLPVFQIPMVKVLLVNNLLPVELLVTETTLLLVLEFEHHLMEIVAVVAQIPVETTFANRLKLHVDLRVTELTPRLVPVFEPVLGKIVVLVCQTQTEVMSANHP